MLFRFAPWEHVSPGLTGVSESVCAMREFGGYLYANTESSGDIFRSADGDSVAGVWRYSGSGDPVLVHQASKHYVTEITDWDGVLFAGTSEPARSPPLPPDVGEHLRGNPGPLPSGEDSEDTEGEGGAISTVG